jgi:hypothetical protein
MRHLPFDIEKKLKPPRAAALKTAVREAVKSNKSIVGLPAVGMEAKKARTLGSISGNPAIE